MRLLSAIMCDDVRTENNGKEILIGCYNNVVIVPNVPFALISLNFRMLFDNEKAGKHQRTLYLKGPNGKEIFKYPGEFLVDEPSEPFVIRLGLSPFVFENYGKHELWLSPEENATGGKEELLMEFYVRAPKSESEKNLVLP